MVSLHAITSIKERIFDKLKEHDIVLAKMCKCLESIQKQTCDTPEREDNDANDDDANTNDDDNKFFVLKEKILCFKNNILFPNLNQILKSVTTQIQE